LTYQLIDNFAAGLDTRKSPLTSPAGTLTRLINAVVTPGGEISKRRAFVNIATVSGSFGLAATAANLYVFGKNVIPALPSWSVPGVGLKGMKVPNPDATLQQMDYDIYDGRVYLACRTGGATVPPAAPTAAENPHYYEDATGGSSTLTEGAGKGYYVRTYKSKIYAILGKLLSFSCVGSPLKWHNFTDAGPPVVDYIGAGNINLSTQDADSEILTSLEVYYDSLAVFSSEAVQIWAVASDPLKNELSQVLRNAGTTAPRSPLQYGSGDVLYLDQSGIRSLKAKDSSNSAAVSDIGSPVDPTVQAMHLDALIGPDMDKAIALLEPSVGRFWMVFPTRILVLSYFPGPKITAWSQFNLAFTAAHAVTCGGRIFLRDTADNIWIYGGIDGTAYDNCGVEIRLPYLDGKKPGHKKQFAAVDATVSGTWTVKVSLDFNNPEAEETVATISVPTWNAGAGELQGYDSHFSLRFYNTDAAPATLSNCAIHYEMGADKD
jgi:hypothetical protein